MIVKLGRAAQDRSNQRSNPSDINTHRASVNIISVTKHEKSAAAGGPFVIDNSTAVMLSFLPDECARAPNGRLNCAIPRFAPV